jgi:hypothetical protein
MVRAIALLAVLAGCGGKKTQGLAPAQDWNAEAAGAAPAAAAGPSPHNPHVAIGGGDPNDPHSGVDMTGGGGDPNDPHASVDMNNPHAGGGVDVTKMGLPTPDPDRQIDPTHHIRGVIKIHPKAKDRVAAGGAIFLIAKKADASGQPSGPPLAVEKLTWTKDELPFELTEANAMVGGTQLAGDVVVLARYDQDGDALSKQPGDVTGQLRVKVPAENVNLFLDTILP